MKMNENELGNVKYTLRNEPITILQRGAKFSIVMIDGIEKQMPTAFIFDKPIEKTPSLSQCPSFLDSIDGLNSPISTFLSFLYKEWLNGKVDLEPSYQRDFVWTIEQQQAYLQAVLDLKAIPTVYSATVFGSRDDGEIVDEIIDGKQRLTTLFHFLENKVSLPCGTYFKELGFDDVLFFYGLEVKLFKLHPFKEHRSLTNQEKLDIFLMINAKGTKLTDSELAHAKHALSE